MESLLVFCRQKALERDKPYIRLDLHPESPAAKIALAMGAEMTNPYAWQIKISDKLRFLNSMTPILEKRVAGSFFVGLSATLQLHFFTSTIDLIWESGRLRAIKPGNGHAQQWTFCIPNDLFPALVLGHRTWQELQSTRPDIFPAHQYLRPELASASNQAALLVETLFPGQKSWIYAQY
jgi:hypothetical protein